jgi:ABC-2 type transport system permease protein
MTSLWPATWKLIRLRLLIWVSGFRRGRTRDKIGRIALLLFFAAIMVFVFYATQALLTLLRSPDLVNLLPNPAALVESLPVTVLGAVFVGILLTSFGVLLQALYLANDMDFLLSAPVPMRAVFLSKLLQAILPNFTLVLLLGLPLLFGLGAVNGYQPVYYPLVVVALAGLALAAAGMSSLLVMVIVRVFPARRVAEVLGFMGALISIVCSQSGQFANYSDMSRDQMRRAADLVSRFDTPWSPLAWAGRGLVRIGEGDWLPGAALLGLTLALAVAVFYLALVSAERLYYTGWASLPSGRTRKRGKRVAGGAARVAGRRPVRLAGPVWAIVRKDFTVLRRDLRNLSQMITPIVLGILYTVLLLRGGGEPPPGRGEAPGWFMQGFRELLVYGDAAISLFVGWMVLGRLATMGFSQEGRSYWLLKTAPISSGRLLAGKFATAFLPATALGWAFLLVLSITRQVELARAIFGFLVVASCFAAASGINLAFGVAGASFDWEDPRHMVRGGSGCLGMIASTLAMGAVLLLFFGPLIGAAFLGLPVSAGQVAGLVLGGLASAACTLVPMRLVRSRVPRLGEG